MAIAEIKWKVVKDTYFFDTTTCYLSENGNHLFYVGKEKQIEILIDSLNELVRKGCAMWLKLGEYEFALDKLSKCPTQTWYSIHQKLYSLEPWGVIKESKKHTTKSLREMFGNEGIVDDFVDFLIYDCGYDEKTVKKYFYKKYKLNGLDIIPTKLYIQIKNEIEDVLGYNDIM